MLLFINIVHADDRELFIVPFGVGDEEFYMVKGDGDLEFGNFFFSPEAAAVKVGAAAGGVGGQPRFVSTTLYDIIIRDVKSRYNKREMVNATIIIMNKMDESDTDAVLLYYLLDPENRKYGEAKEIFEEIPSACKDALYERETNICTYPNGTEFNATLIVLHKNITIPLNTSGGEWKFYIEFSSSMQPLVETFKAFRVGPLDVYLIIVVLSVVSLIGLLFLRETKPAHKKKPAKYKPKYKKRTPLEVYLDEEEKEKKKKRR